MICDRVAIVVDGKVRAVGAVSELVSAEATSYEATFVGAVPADLETPVLANHVASGESWVQVTAEHRDDLMVELGERGARVVSLNPVRTTLEDLLMRHYEETGS
jgi:ABC-type multidrug transport system ATPase subunit